MHKNKVVPHKVWPLVETSSWDGPAAVRAMREWASSDGSGDPDTIDWPKYAQGFTQFDEEREETFGAYKLPHHNVIEGEFVTDLRGVQAARQRASQTDMPEEDRDGVFSHLDRHYEEFGLEPPERLIVDGENAVKLPETWPFIPSSRSRPEMPKGDSYDEMFAVFEGLHSRTVKIGTRGPVTENAELSNLFTVRTGLVATADFFAFDMFPSTQAVDTYGTRMSQAALKTYEKNSIAGVAFINSHRTGGCMTESELPLGYSFDAEILGDQVDEMPFLRREELPEPGSVDLLQQGLRLHTWDYMQRGYYPNGRGEPGTDDIILGIESRSIREVSIGFGHDLPFSFVQYVCGVCGLIMNGEEVENPDTGEMEACPHAPMIKDKETGLTAFAWVYGSRLYEKSSVWKGATPGAIVAHARRVAPTLSAMELDFLEDLWRVPVRPVKMVSVPEPKGIVSPVTPVYTGTAPAEKLVFNTSSVGIGDVSAGRTALDIVQGAETPGGAVDVGAEMQKRREGEKLPSLHALIRGLTSGMAEVLASIYDLNQSVTELSVTIKENRAETPTVELTETTEEPDVPLMVELMEDLIEKAVKARVRALGAEKFDPKVYRQALALMTVPEIKAEIRTHEAVAREKFSPGRPTAGAEETDKGAPARDAHLYRA